MSDEIRYRNGHRLCNAKNNTCKAFAMKDKTKCRNHGGLSLSGINSPRFKTGRYSKYLPQGLMTKYDEARKDPDLLNLRDEISLNDARLKQLIEKLPEGGASRSWIDLRSTWTELLNAQRAVSNAATDPERRQAQQSLANVFRQLNEVIEDGASEAGVWNDIITTVDNRRKLVASESKRLTDMEQTITAEKAMALVYAVLDIIRRNVVTIVTDPAVQKKLTSKIATDVRGLVTIPQRESADTETGQ